MSGPCPITSSAPLQIWSWPPRRWPWETQVPRARSRDMASTSQRRHGCPGMLVQTMSGCQPATHAAWRAFLDPVASGPGERTRGNVMPGRLPAITGRCSPPDVRILTSSRKLTHAAWRALSPSGAFVPALVPRTTGRDDFAWRPGRPTGNPPPRIAKIHKVLGKVSDGA